MKKIMLLMFVAFVLFFLSCVTTSAPAKLGGTVLYIAKIDPEMHPHDVAIIARLEGLGFTVTPMYAKDVTGEEAADYDYIYISESNSSGDVKAKFILTEKPVLSCEMWIGDEMGFTGAEKNVDNGNKEDLYSEIKIAQPGHPLAAGFSGNVAVYDSLGIMGFGKPGGDVQVIATAIDDPEIAFIYVYEKGAKNLLGDVVPGLRVWYFLFENFEEVTTPDGWKLWEAAVRYTFK